MKTRKNHTAFMFLFLAAFFLAGSGDAFGSGPETDEVPILCDWRGDYPVSELHRFPEDQRTSPMGCLGNDEAFRRVWEAFKSDEELPDVDFDDNLGLFARNVAFYNRIAIVKVLLRDGVAEILTVETRSALPIEDQVGIALAVIPRAGVEYIRAGDEEIPVLADQRGRASDPLNGTYVIEGEDVTLQDGRSEKALGPDSATKVRTFVIGDMVAGDLDGDGDEDRALILVHDPGGSGTFYYVAVAERMNGGYRGTNAMLLGDRIRTKDLRVLNGLVVVTYAIRGADEPMSTAPSVEVLLTIALDEGKLKPLEPLGRDE